jgi:3-hydroxyisobutyrate dehydrogenase-like beta-hydroxyacid dehydrogenase
MRVGFIGLGTMGAPMAMNALTGGHALVVLQEERAGVEIRGRDRPERDPT